MEKKTVRFNVIDLVIIIAVLAVVSALIVRQFSGASEINSEKEKPIKISMEVRVSGIQEESKNYITVGDPVRDSSNKTIARIADVNITPAKGIYIVETGEVKELEIPTKIDAYVTLECVGKYSDDGIFLSNNALAAVSQQFGIYTPYISISGSILSIDYEDITESEYNEFLSSLSTQ